MKKLTYILCFALLLPLFCVFTSVSVSAVEYKFGINAINSGISEGQVLLLTPSYGANIAINGNNYSWCKVAVFDWSEKEGAYVLISIDTKMGTDMQKTSIIPPNGFALSVNLGNDYPSLYASDPINYAWCAGKPNYTNAVSNNVYNNLDSLTLGTKVYLTGIHLDESTFEYSGDISKYYTSAFTTKGFIHVTDKKPEGAYEPSNNNMLEAPEFKNTKDLYTLGDVKIEWKAVSGATKYYVTACNSTINANGPSILAQETNSTSITLSQSKLTVGAKYTVRVYASGSTGASNISEYSFTVAAKRASNSMFKDKTIVAFGDSITAWTGWVSMLYGQIGSKAINAGVGGDTTNHALARIEKDVIAKSPDLVIVNFGMNDQAIRLSDNKNLTPLAQYEANYRTIIEKIQATGSKIILVAVHDVCQDKYNIGDGLNYGGKDSSGKTNVDLYNDVVKKLANEYNLGLLDINTLAQNQLNTIILDGIHLNDAGQAKYSEWISDYLFEYAEANTDWGTSNDNDNDNDDNNSNDVSSGDNDVSNGETDVSDTTEPDVSVPESSTPDTSDITDNSAGEPENEQPDFSDVSDEKSDNDSITDESTPANEDGGFSTTEIIIVSIVMFIVISVIGVMFVKVVIKNKKN